MNERIDNLIKWLDFPEVGDEKLLVLATKNGSDDSRLFTKEQVRKKIRKILGIDKQCFQCSDYHFDGDLSLVEGTENLVCQNCAEKIINGDIKLRE